MAQHYPVVHMGENSKVKIAYSLGRGGEEDNGWTCQQVGLLFLFSFVRLGSMCLCFSVHWSISRDEKLVIDVHFPGMVWISPSPPQWFFVGGVFIDVVDMTPSSPPKSLTQKAWVYNDGTGDVGDSPTQFLLVRNLDTMLQEEDIAKGLAKLESIPKRILLIRDRKTNVSWGFAFIEYQDVSVSHPTPSQ
jgi:hypothetical protein